MSEPSEPSDEDEPTHAGEPEEGVVERSRPEVLDSGVLEGWAPRREREDEIERTLTSGFQDETPMTLAHSVQPTLTAQIASSVAASLGGTMATHEGEAFGVTMSTQAPGERLGPEGQLPEFIGRFRVIRELGRGGMGVVYEAEQDIPSRRVALKTLALTASRKALAQFRVEVNATARVVHPGIPQVYEVFNFEGIPVLVMECVHGEHIDVATRELSRQDRVRVLRDVALAVEAVHERGVVHRDLKPSNVLVTESGQPKVLDFGIAALGERELRGSFTIQYASPEQLNCLTTDARCDVYGLGALAHLVLVGRPSHELDDFDNLRDIIECKQQPLAPPPELPSSLAAILVKALAPDLDDRYPSALALAEDLDRFLTSRPVQAFEGFEGGSTAAEQRYLVTREPSPTEGERLAIEDRSENRVVASLRTRPLRREAGASEAKGAHWFDVEVPADLVSAALVLEDFEFAPDAHESEAVMRLVAELFENVLEQRLQLVFIACAPERYPDQLRLGFRPIGRVVQLPEGGAIVPMVQVTHDLDYFVRVGSPLAAVLRTQGHFGDRRAFEWLEAVIAATKIAPPIVAAEQIDAPLLAGLSDQGRHELLRSARPRLGAPGDILIEEGEEGRWLALVEVGLVEIVVGDTVVAVRGQGELIGEMGFLLDTPRTARVAVAAPGTRLTVIDLSALSALSRSSDREQLWRNLATALAHKLETLSSRS